MNHSNTPIRTIAIFGLILPLWFLAIYLLLASLHPGFSHFTKAISELGVIGAPHALAWNILGYGVSGLVIAALGWALGRRLGGSRGSRFAAGSLVASGLLMSLSGIFPGDFDNPKSFTMIMHAIGSLGSFVAFLIAGFTLPLPMRRLPLWKPFFIPLLALVVGSIVTGFLRSGETPGLGQRLGFLCYFLWIGLISYAILRETRTRDPEIGDLKGEKEIACTSRAQPISKAQ